MTILHHKEEYIRLKENIISKKPTILIGPAGVGKTSTVHKIAKELEYDIVEINSSSDRSYNGLKNSISTSYRCESFSKGKILLLDEADGITKSESDTEDKKSNARKTGTDFVLEMIKSDPQASIVLTANFEAKMKKSLLDSLDIIKFKRLTETEIKMIINELNKLIPESRKDFIIKKCNGDIRKVIQYVETNCTNTYKTEEIYYGFNDYVKTVLTSKNKAQVNKMDDIVTTFGFKPEYNPAKGIVTKEMLMWLEENVQRSGKELPYNLELISSMNQLVFKTKEEYIRKAFINMVKPLEGNGWLSFPTQYRKGNGNYCGHANVIPIPDDKYMCLSCLCILQDKKPKETPIDKNFANGLLEFTKEIKLGKVEKKPKGLTSFGDF